MKVKEMSPPREKRSSVLKAVPSSLNNKKRTLDATVSTNQVDRDGEIIEPSAFKDRIDTFMENPVFLWMHDPHNPIGKVADLDIKKDRIDAQLQFREEGKSQLSDEIFGLYEDGTLKTFSIGFRVFKMEFEEDDDHQQKPPRVTEAELYEVSAVSIPANPGAMAKYVKYGLVEKVTRDLAPGDADSEVLRQAKEIARNIIERKLLGEGVPLEHWRLVESLRIALMEPKRIPTQPTEDGRVLVLADAHKHIQDLLSAN